MAIRKASGAAGGANIRLAADIGGTFTDVVVRPCRFAHAGYELSFHASTPVNNRELAGRHPHLGSLRSGSF